MPNNNSVFESPVTDGEVLVSAASVQTWADQVDAEIRGGRESYSLWLDPFFQTVRNTDAVIENRSALFGGHTSGAWVAAQDDPGAKNPSSGGAWRIGVGGLLGFAIRFDVPPTESLAINEGDIISIAAKVNAPAAANSRCFARFFNAAGSYVSAQINSPVVTNTDGRAILKIEAQAVPLNAAGVEVYFGDDGQYITALWCVPAEVAGDAPPSRNSQTSLRAEVGLEELGAEIEAVGGRISNGALKANLWPDPTFRLVRDVSDQLAGLPAVDSRYTNAAWASGRDDPNAKNPLSGGAWRVFQSSGLFGIPLNFANGILADFDISEGDVISIGARMKAADATNYGFFFRFTNNGNFTGPQFGASLIGNGEWVTRKVESLIVPPGANGGVIYMNTNGAETYLSALWAVLDGAAGDTMPMQPVASPGVIASGIQGITQTPDPEALALAPRIFGIEGLETNIYFANLRAGLGHREFEVATARGQHQIERWTHTPAIGSGDEGTIGITVESRDPDTLFTRGSAVSAFSLTAAGGAGGQAVRLLQIGDSTTASNHRSQRVHDLSQSRPSDAQITLMGTRGPGGDVNHEGQGGWSAERYHSPGDAFFADNPFTATATDQFNAAYYLSDTSQSAPNVITWSLGINDVFGAANDDDLASRMDAYLTFMDQMIGLEASSDVISWNEVDAGIVHLVALPMLPASQDAFGVSYGAAQNRARYWRNIVGCAHRILAHYRTAESDNIYLLPFNAAIDTAHNFTRSAEVPFNAHTADTVARQNNGVHPSSGGGNSQLADCEYAAVNWLAANGIV